MIRRLIDRAMLVLSLLLTRSRAASITLRLFRIDTLRAEWAVRMRFVSHQRNLSLSR
jgi:hypothetical protein